MTRCSFDVSMPAFLLTSSLQIHCEAMYGVCMCSAHPVCRYLPQDSFLSCIGDQEIHVLQRNLFGGMVEDE